jgi:hypothetical protein
MPDRLAEVVESAVLASLAEFWADPQPDVIGRMPAGKIAGSIWDDPVPEGARNPYWEIIRQVPLEEPYPFGRCRPEPNSFVMRKVRGGGSELLVARDSLCKTFSWSIPSPGDMKWLKGVLEGRGVVECGAGGGYWAWQMRQAGIDVVAYEPQEVTDNHYAMREWTGLLRDGHEASGQHPERALFLCWPSYSDPWAAHSLACYQGDLLIYCGEGEGGCCADDEFFKLLDAEWGDCGYSPAHVSYWGIHCYLTAYRRK